MRPGDFKIAHHKLLLSGDDDITVTDVIKDLLDETYIRENNLPKRMGFISYEVKYI